MLYEVITHFVECRRAPGAGAMYFDIPDQKQLAVEAHCRSLLNFIGLWHGEYPLVSKLADKIPASGPSGKRASSGELAREWVLRLPDRACRAASYNFV